MTKLKYYYYKVKRSDWIYIIGILLSLILLSYITIAGILWVLCWSFSIEFTFKLSLGFWVLFLILLSLFNK
jgi:hypothetical protein